MEINPHIFRAYDIRGKYPGEINKETAYKIGYALGKFVRARRKFQKIDILIGQDNRFSSPILFKGLSQGITDTGANAASIGVCTAPMFYFASQHYKFDDAGIMITASHLPKNYNGFKLSREVPFPIDSQTGLLEIKKIAVRAGSKKDESDDFKEGKTIQRDISKEYIKFVLRDFDFKKIVSLKIAVDTGNGPAGIIIPEIFKKTKCRIFHLFPGLDGTFPNRPLDCTKEKNLKKLKREILKRRADFGVAFDGDGDRIVFLDENGKFVPPTIITAFMACILLRKRPGEKILYTVNQSRIIPEVIKGNKGKAVIWKVGHSNIKRKMKQDDVFFGGEASAHYFLKTHYFCEAPFFVLFTILKELSETKRKFSELVKPFQKYFHSGEINFKIRDKKRALNALENRFQKGKILRIDGIRIDFPDWWFNIRSSHTEPVLRLVVEAKNKKLMESKVGEIKSIIKNF